MTCLFIDGLDEFNEFDRVNDVDNLLGLIEEFSTNNKIKTCVSSRPEDYLVKQLLSQVLPLSHTARRPRSLQDPLPCLHTTSSWCFHTSCLIIVLFRSSVRTTRALTESSSYVVCFTLHFSYAQLVGFSVSA